MGPRGRVEDLVIWAQGVDDIVIWAQGVDDIIWVQGVDDAIIWAQGVDDVVILTQRVDDVVPGLVPRSSIRTRGLLTPCVFMIWSWTTLWWSYLS